MRKGGRHPFTHMCSFLEEFDCKEERILQIRLPKQAVGACCCCWVFLGCAVFWGGFGLDFFCWFVFQSGQHRVAFLKQFKISSQVIFYQFGHKGNSADWILLSCWWTEKIIAVKCGIADLCKRRQNPAVFTDVGQTSYSLFKEVSSFNRPVTKPSFDHESVNIQDAKTGSKMYGTLMIRKRRKGQVFEANWLIQQIKKLGQGTMQNSMNTQGIASMN